MLLVALLATLVAGGFCATAKPAEPHQSTLLEEPVFGIDFSMENIRISIATPGGYAKGLATIKGDAAYQELMMSYYVLCYWAHDSQTPPFSYKDYLGTKSTEHQNQIFLETDPELHEWYTGMILGQFEVSGTTPELDAYHNDTDVAILANAVKDLRRAAVNVLSYQYNTTMPDRPLVSIAAPSFMWTTIEPEPCDESFDPYCAQSCDTYSNSWHHIFGLKISGAVHRAGFRQKVVEDLSATSLEHGNLKTTCPIAPAGYASFWNPSFPVRAHTSTNQSAANSGTHYEGPPAVVVELTNATLSLWAQHECSIWSPWHTLPQYGAWQQFADYPGYMYDPEGDVWRNIVARIQVLREFLRHPYHEVLDVYLAGDAWQPDMVDAFEAYRVNHKYPTLNVVYRDAFSASDGAATIAREMLDSHRP